MGIAAAIATAITAPMPSTKVNGNDGVILDIERVISTLCQHVISGCEFPDNRHINITMLIAIDLSVIHCTHHVHIIPVLKMACWILSECLSTAGARVRHLFWPTCRHDGSLHACRRWVYLGWNSIGKVRNKSATWAKHSIKIYNLHLFCAG